MTPRELAEREVPNFERIGAGLAYEAEVALKESQERFKALFRHNPVPCLVQSLDNLLTVDVNDAYVLASGFSRSDLVGQQPPNLWADPVEERAFRNTLKTQGRVNGMHARALRRDGSQFDTLVYAELIQHGNERLMVDMSAEEKSRRALQQSEARFFKAFRHSPICMTLTRMSDGRHLEVNGACEQVFGASPRVSLERHRSKQASGHASRCAKPVSTRCCVTVA